jgi:hypothetical protein
MDFIPLEKIYYIQSTFYYYFLNNRVKDLVPSAICKHCHAKKGALQKKPTIILREYAINFK